MADSASKISLSTFKAEAQRLGLHGPELLCGSVRKVEKEWQKDQEKDKILQLVARGGKTRLRLELTLLMWDVGPEWLCDEQQAVVEYFSQAFVKEVLVAACGYEGDEATFIWNCAIENFFEEHPYTEAKKAFREFFAPLHPFFRKIRQGSHNYSVVQLS